MKYDIIIVGACSAGSYLANKMSKKGYKVLVIDKSSKDNIGNKMDIFHIGRDDFDKFDIPKVSENDEERAFYFYENYTYSPSNKYPKHTSTPTIGLHMHEYFLLMNKIAEDNGVTFEYDANFDEVTYNDKHQINGIKYTKNGIQVIELANVVVDCSGIPAVIRRSLPDNYGIEKFSLTPEDMFYVVLWYCEFKDKDHNSVSDNWPFYKVWIAPSGYPKGGILGIGACHSYEYAEEILHEFLDKIPIPEYNVTKVEKGATPYCRSPYSFVGDNLVISGDAACITKPNCGEGVTATFVQLDIVSEVLDEALQKGDCSKQNLWAINTKYNATQGADFAFLRAVLVKAISATEKEFEFFFKNDIIFSEKLMNGLNTGLKLSIGDILHVVNGIIKGLVTKNFSFDTLKKLFSGIILGFKLSSLYKKFPSTPEGFTEWSKKADILWKKVGKME